MEIPAVFAAPLSYGMKLEKKPRNISLNGGIDMGRLQFIALTALTLTACGRDHTQRVGQAETCANGQYFSYSDQTCRVYEGFSYVQDEFEQNLLIDERKGVRVPVTINGQSPFQISFRYDVKEPTTFDMAIKKYKDGHLGGTTYSQWSKAEVGPGQGWKTVTIYPEGPLDKGPAGVYLNGSWLTETGYVLELNGGDRYEDQDIDGLPAWRVVGLQVDPTANADLRVESNRSSADQNPVEEEPYPNMELVLTDFSADSSAQACEPIRASVQIVHYRPETVNPVYLEVALKDVTAGWSVVASDRLRVPDEVPARLEFELTFDATADAAEDCSLSPGKAYKEDGSGRYAIDINPWDNSTANSGAWIGKISEISYYELEGQDQHWLGINIVD
jgi:hypothetical protein